MDFQRVIKENKLLICILLIALIIRVVFVFSTPVRIWDETVYANLGYDLSQNPFHYSVASSGWSDFIPSEDSIYSWPKMGFRAPLLPYLLALFYLFNLGFLVKFFMPLVGALSVLLVYLFGKKLFNKNVALYSAILFSLIPLHITYSAKILTDVLFTFFVLLTFFSFWKGYEEGNQKHKILFGVFLALTLLSRYTALWIIPVFLFYFLIRDKSLNFLKDKNLWFAILAFFAVLIPWFFYGSLEYGNPLGAFIHGAKAALYWGGVQSWTFFFRYWWSMFSITGLIFILGVAHICYKKSFLKKEIYLLLIWFAFFLGMAIYMPHKEDRFILAISPVISLISGYFIEKIKKYKKLILIGITFLLVVLLVFQFYQNCNDSYSQKNECFLEGNKFLESTQANSLIVTDESAVVYYYTKKETRFYPNPWNYETLNSWKQSSPEDKNIYILFGDYILKPEEEFNKIQEDLEDSSDKVFECSRDGSFSIVYKLKSN